MGQPVVHWEIASATDGQVLANFYSQLFDWKMNYHPELNYTLVDTGGQGGINGGIMTGPQGKPFVVFYVQVDDLQAYLNKAESLGGKTAVPPTEIPNVGAFAFFTDPDGNIIGIYKSSQQAG